MPNIFIYIAKFTLVIVNNMYAHDNILYKTDAYYDWGNKVKCGGQ